MHEVSRRVWGLRLRRTEQELALSLLIMLPTAHLKDGGVRIVNFRSWIPTPPSPCLRLTESLAVSAQDSGPSRSLVFTRKALSSSTSCRFSPAHSKRVIAIYQHLTLSETLTPYAETSLPRQPTRSPSCVPFESPWLILCPIQPTAGKACALHATHQIRYFAGGVPDDPRFVIRDHA